VRGRRRKKEEEKAYEVIYIQYIWAYKVYLL
jgi:hypothetical protein